MKEEICLSSFQYSETTVNDPWVDLKDSIKQLKQQQTNKQKTLKKTINRVAQNHLDSGFMGAIFISHITMQLLIIENAQKVKIN